MLVSAANLRLSHRLPCDEERAPPSNKEVMFKHKLPVSESQLFAVFGQTVGAFGQMVGVG